eukprot:3623655-Rhodomonas_salina.3
MEEMEMEQSLLTEESHFKMSKKIAQLTRVIGMLVNKNEEQEYEKQYLSEAFEVELGKVVEEANTLIEEARMAAGSALLFRCDLCGADIAAAAAAAAARS